MNKNTMKKDNTAIMSDKYLSESGVQGGKIIGEKLALFSFIFGIPLLIIGMWSLFNMLFVSGFPKDMLIILIILGPQSWAIIIGLLAIIGGFSIYRAKHVKN